MPSCGTVRVSIQKYTFQKAGYFTYKMGNLRGTTYRARLGKPSRIFIRGGNLERAEALGRPVSYDRVACRIVSVYALSHWEDESTIRNYLTK